MLGEEKEKKERKGKAEHYRKLYIGESSPISKALHTKLGGKHMRMLSQNQSLRTKYIRKTIDNEDISEKKDLWRARRNSITCPSRMYSSYARILPEVDSR